MINPNKGKIVSVADQQDLRKLLRKFEKQKEAKPQTPKDLEYAVRLIEHYQNLQETGGHLVKLFQPGPLGIDKYVPHKAFFDATANYQQVLFRASNQTGKALPDWTGVCTPNGFKPIADLAIGDKVIGSDGKACNVTGVFPQGVRPTYKFTLDNGEEIFSDAEHLWMVRNTKKGADAPFEVLTTQQMAEKKNALWALPQAPVVEFEHKDVKIDPYLLGILLGDGALNNDYIGFTTADAELLESFAELTSIWGLSVKKRSGNNHYDYSASSNLRCRRGWGVNPLLETLRELRCDTLSLNKHIPEDYKINSKEVRLAILQGLMDTDGYCDKKGMCIFYSSSIQLAEGVAFIARSLGINASIKTKIVKYKGQPNQSWLVYLGKPKICLFRLSRKKIRQQFPERNRCQTIRNIERIGEEPCTCISVDSHDKLFLIDKFVVTHNTQGGAFACSCWATGDYPDWWEGRVFDKAPVIWACGDTNDTVREILQSKFLGTPEGTGLIAANKIYDVVKRPNTGGSVDSIWVKNNNGKLSQIKFKTYQSGPESFYGKPVDVVWFDEEPDGKDAPLIWNQAYIRLTTTNGTFIITFTPLLGWTALLKDFTEKAVDATPRKQDG